MNAYVKSKSRKGDYIKRKVRINAIGSSYSSTGLISDFNKAISPDGSDEGGDEIMNEMFLKSWNGIPGTSEDMVYSSELRNMKRREILVKTYME